MGKLISDTPSKAGQRTDLVPLRNEVGKTATFKELNLTHKQAANYQLIANNPEAVKNAFEIAKENNDIPTESLIIQIIKEEKK